MATIKAIEDRTIHQIQSGQVIVDLCSVVKELVENSLDAGATSIDVRFKNQGLDSIEVQDNGDGITPQNYETVALKHHTSKLSSYSDLNTLETFGFRGEALSSLCALSTFTITTCMAIDAPKGTKLDFEVSGKLKRTSIVAAQKGTTASVERLFHNLPVRRREFERNIKREWNRVVGLLGQYACIQTGVKMSVTQQVAKGKKVTLFSTKGNPSTRENIINVYGAKTLTALVTLDLNLELEPSSGPSQHRRTHEDGEMKKIHIIGHVSRPAHGEGRMTPDRQMFFVNGRPCGLPQVSKTFNEVYKQFNSSQSPFIFANIEMDTHLYDVNVSPDKRTILLHDQSRMLDHLKDSLSQLFESQDYTIPLSLLPVQKPRSYRQLTIARTQAKPSSEPTSQDSTASDVSTTSTDTDEEAEIPGQLDSPIQDPNTDNEELGLGEDGKSRHDALSQDAMNRDQEAVSLISDWLGNKPDYRVEPKKPAPDKSNKASKGKQAQVDGVDRSDDSESFAEEPMSIPQLPRKKLDFNDRVSGDRQLDSVFPEWSAAEEPIPAIKSPTRLVLAAVPTGTTTTRPLRRPATVATITIGDHTITASVGSPCPKRARVEASADNGTSTSVLPSFGSRLSQRFAAPFSKQQSAANDHSITDAESESGSPHSLESEYLNEADSRDVDFEDTSANESEIQSEKTSEDVFMNSSRNATEQEEDANIEAEIEDYSTVASRGEPDDDYVDEDEKRFREEAKVAEMIRSAEEEALRPSGDTTKRANLLLKGAKRNNASVHLVQTLDVSVSELESQARGLKEALSFYDAAHQSTKVDEEPLDSERAEEKLSLAINKTDFASMKIIGQFNLGFILASRTSTSSSTDSGRPPSTDDLFIIDQHASDEKYNFERLQANTIVQSQRLVRPKTLDLTAIEEEIVKENLSALGQNGFIVTVDESGDYPVGQHCQLVSLPLSRETTFSLSDLEELISLLSDHHGGTGEGSIPRPSKVRKMLAMRACRSSIMIGRTLTQKQMSKVVMHMGEIDKPWNCPHGRPTMRHLCGLGAWDEVGWKEGDGVLGQERTGTDWAAYVRSERERTM